MSVRVADLGSTHGVCILSDVASPDTFKVVGRVKWYDTGKGYGFVAADDDGGDVLLHANCLRRAGLGHAAEGARVVLEAMQGERGRQAVAVIELDEMNADDEPPKGEPKPTEIIGAASESSEWLPARVKWFDRAKGFGFLNIFGDSADVFVHMETLRLIGLPDLAPGEAIAVRVVEGPRGKMASEVCLWESLQSG